MPKNKKKFICKKNAVTFQVVHRSQQDPLAADETAPQHVLKECSKKKNKEEEHKYGIFFDDEYDYMQHLRSVSDFSTDWNQITYKANDNKKSKSSKSKVLLPSSVFESEMEDPVGLLNKAAPIYGPRPELDPDIVAALDDDFDYDNPDNELEDNFVQLANMEGSESSEDDSEWEDDADDGSDIASLDSENFREVETKSKFTDYSMTSSVIRRNEQLTLLDDRFEHMFKQYEDNEIGSLPCEEIEGILSSQDEQLLKLAEKKVSTLENSDASLKNRILLAAEVADSSEEEYDVLVVNNNTEKWDCESILSTYSNIYNHPAKISEPKGLSKIKISKKTGVPVDVIGNTKLTAHNLSMLNDCEKNPGPRSIISHLSELSIRSKNETPEEKRIRKHNLKEYRRERRMERKANTEAFKKEKMRQEKIILNVRNNQQGIKIM